MSQSSIHKMQRYVVGGVVLISAIGLSFPIAMARVSATKKFPGQAVKSQDCTSHSLEEPKVITWAKDCAPLKVEPKKVDAKPMQSAAPQPIATQPESKPTPKTSIPSLQLGSSGDSVIILQEQLQLAGTFSGTVDGVFGTETELAVQDLQQRLKLEPNGIADTNIQTTLKSRTIDR